MLLLIIHVVDMDETYGAYVDDEYFDNHDYTDDTDDDNDHKNDSHTAAAAAHGAGAAPRRPPPCSRRWRAT